MPQIPMPLPGNMDPKQNATVGDVTPSNRSSQTPQAAAQNVPQGRANAGGKSVISRSQQSPLKVTGKMGKPSFRG